MQDHVYAVTISATSKEEADQVLVERIGYDEDLSEHGIGNYTIDSLDTGSLRELVLEALSKAGGAIKFDDLNQVPNGTSGYFSVRTDTGYATSIDAVRTPTGRWYSDRGQPLEPKKGWIFTAHHGKPNDEARADAVIALFS